MTQQQVIPDAAVGENAPMTLWNIWAEGYRVTGNESAAGKLNASPIEAESFDAAVRIHMASLPTEPEYPGGPTPASYYRVDERGQWRMWGCALFPDEASARIAFG